MAARPKCDRVDCFQNKCGARCELLTSIPSQPCPFYKTDAQVEAGRQKAHNRLVEEGRYDLIQEYEHNPQSGRW